MKIHNETKIGIMVIVCLVLLGYMTFRSESFSFKNRGYHVKAHFNNIDGVNLNSPVMVNGYEVGAVEDIKIVDGEHETIMELTLSLDAKAKLREGAKAYVKNLGLMGEKYVGLTSGEKDKPYLEEGDIIVGEDPTDFSKLIEDGHHIASDVKDITANINERLQKNKEQIDAILVNLSAVTKDLSEVLAKVNSPKVDEIMTNLHQLSKNLEEMTYDLKLHPWKLLHRTKEKGIEKIPEQKMK